MEKRIKILYLITIIAILAFLGMQVFWLYGRYGFYLKEYERALCERIAECVETYNVIRDSVSKTDSNSSRQDEKDNISIPSFSLSQHYSDTVKTTRTVRIFTYKYSAYDLLGIEPGTPLTDEQKNKAAEIAFELKKEPADSLVYDATGAKDENEAWASSKNVQIERLVPFTVDGIDSVLNKAGIKARISLAKADSMVWRPLTEYRTSLLTPEVSMTIPYSQLEGQTVTIVSKINPIDILPGMSKTLIIAIVVSALLIVCLILQFSTVLKFSRLDKLRNSFITTMIHELKRPISTLKMCVSGLNNEKMMEDSDTKKELLAETRNALDNLSAYFSKLRDITFNNVEQIPLNIKTINLYALFDTVATAIALPADKRVDIINNIDKTVEVSADGSHLYNILNNLVENAVKYSGDSVEIQATAAENNGVVELRVSDTGDGISPGDLQHIFKRFYRGKAATGRQPGMGLGLTYVKLLVDAHGGDIAVESSEGNGTCFTIRLPQ